MEGGTMGRLSGEKRVRLSRRMIQRLNEIKRERDLSFDQFKIAISAPFTSQTLYHAMQGKPLWENNYAFLAEFVRKHTRQPAVPGHTLDTKSRAAGEKESDDENGVGHARSVDQEADDDTDAGQTPRGSR
jgi:hypothetical protein